MKSKALPVRSILQMTENRAKCCQFSGHSASLHLWIGAQEDCFAVGAGWWRSCRTSVALPQHELQRELAPAASAAFRETPIKYCQLAGHVSNSLRLRDTHATNSAIHEA